ncbi:unnamed protein product, partial [Mesorhabditis spiculigera]
MWLLALFVSAVAAQAIQSTTQCPPGSNTVFALRHNVSVGAQLRTLPAPNMAVCSDHCVASLDCASFEFSGANCQIYGAGDNGDKRTRAFSKTCTKSDRVCFSPFHFDVFEQKILVGFAREVVAAENIQACMAGCLNAFDTFGFECESVMFYPADKECILNTEDRLDRPDLFVDEVDDQVIYMDNNCAGSQCYAPYLTQYIAVEGMQLENELDRIINVDLESCESLCTQRLSLTTSDFNCKSFMYNNVTRSCVLSDERSTPLGRGKLVPTEGFTYYEKKCFASPNTCRNTPSFVRVPQKILVGFAAFVMENVPSVTMCLDQCTNPPPETGDDFVCKSVMYYYNEQECILNAETRLSKPDLFIPEGDDFQVDYFDIACHLNKEDCPSGTSPKVVRTLNSALPEGEGDLHVLKGTKGTVEQCMLSCMSLAPEKCRSFNFDKATGRCDLMYLDGKSTLRPVVRQGVDLYDTHCLAVQPLVEGQCAVDRKDALFSRVLHTKQRGIAAKDYKVVSLTSCLEVCAGNPTCAGVNYNRRVGQCEVFDAIDGDADVNEHVDFYRNLCVVKEQESSVSAAANVPIQKVVASAHRGDLKDGLQAAKKARPHIKHQEHHRRAPESRDALPLGPPVEIPRDAVHTICNYEGIKVQIKHTDKFSGVIFVKNKYDTCRVEVAAQPTATLTLGLPKDFGMKPITLEEMEEEEKEAKEGKDAKAELVKEDTPKPDDELRRVRRQLEQGRECGIADLGNGTYTATVVVQTNNLGIPGLVTSMDQLYEVSCDYSSMLGGKVQAGYNMTVNGPEASLIQPRGKIELGNPVAMQMTGEGDAPLSQAKLGDILELKWEILAMDDELDFFVKDCVAEPGQNAKSEERLQLLEGGCPTPAVAMKLIPGPVEQRSSAVKIAKMQAFRFDSSPSVRISCTLEICKGDCTPVECALTTGQRQSWGRKKRSVENDVTEFETARYKVPRIAQATTSIVIVDPLQTVSEPFALQKQSSLDLFSEDPVEQVFVAPEGQFCLRQMFLFSIFGVLLFLTVAQAAVVAHYIFRRYFAVSKKL